MLKFALVVIIFFLAYTQLTPDKKSSKSSSEDGLSSTNRVDEFKKIGQRVSKSSKAYKKMTNDYLYKFKSINSRQQQSSTYAAFQKEVQNYYRNTYSYRKYNDLNNQEQAMYDKLIKYMNKDFQAIDRLTHEVYVASAAAKTRAYNRECGKRA